MGVPVSFAAFSAELQRAAAVEDAWRLMTDAAFAFGYVSVDYGVARLVPEAPGFAIVRHLATNDWSERYAERGYGRHDRFTRAKLTRITPYTYAEIWNDPPESELQREMEDDIRAHGVNSGLGIPLHGPGPLLAAVDLGHAGTEAEHAALDAQHRPLLVLLAALFNARMHQLLRLGPSAADALADRERQCLLWAARGKTAWETGTILAISESAAKKHLASAAAKLDARTRTQAVAAAIARGLIQP